MKKKIIIVFALCLCCIFLMGYIIQASDVNPFSEWGKTMKQSSEVAASGDYSIVSKKYQEYNKDTVSVDQIFAIGTDVLVTKAEIEQAQAYYENFSNTTDKNSAEEYMLTYDAMYIKALEEGCYATPEEVTAYVESLKEEFSDPDNAEILENVISGFGSEEEYWAYQNTVYTKSLPIQKLVSKLKESFTSSKGAVKGTEEYDQEFTEWYEQYMHEEQERQNFTKIEDGKEITEDMLTQFSID